MPGAKAAVRVARSSGAKNWANGIVIVDAHSVQEAILAVEDAVSPTSLLLFLQTMVSPYFAEVILDNAAGHGGGTPGGSWDPLSESTLAIRHALGYYDDEAVNERTGDLLHHVIETRDFSSLGTLGAEMQIPEHTNNTVLLRKLETAQEGRTQTSSEMLPGTETPARPVLPELRTQDLMAVTKMLQTFIMHNASQRMMTIGDAGA